MVHRGFCSSTSVALGSFWKFIGSQSDHSGDLEEDDELSEASNEEFSALGNDADLFQDGADQSDSEILDPSQQSLDADAQEWSSTSKIVRFREFDPPSSLTI